MYNITNIFIQELIDYNSLHHKSINPIIFPIFIAAGAIVIVTAWLIDIIPAYMLAAAVALAICSIYVYKHENDKLLSNPKINISNCKAALVQIKKREIQAAKTSRLENFSCASYVICYEIFGSIHHSLVCEQFYSSVAEGDWCYAIGIPSKAGEDFQWNKGGTIYLYPKKLFTYSADLGIEQIE